MLVAVEKTNCGQQNSTNKYHSWVNNNNNIYKTENEVHVYHILNLIKQE